MHEVGLGFLLTRGLGCTKALGPQPQRKAETRHRWAEGPCLLCLCLPASLTAAACFRLSSVPSIWQEQSGGSRGIRVHQWQGIGSYTVVSLVLGFLFVLLCAMSFAICGSARKTMVEPDDGL